MTETNEKVMAQTPGNVGEYDPTKRVPDDKRGLNNPDPHTGESASQIEESKRAEGEDDFEHGELLVQARREAGFRRAGYVFPGTEKTIIPANTLSKQRYDAIINETQLVVLEKPKAALKEGATEGVPVAKSFPATVMNQGQFALGGSAENATPEMLEKAERGEAMGHPSMGANVPQAAGGVFNRAIDSDLEDEANEQREKRAEKAKKAEAKEAKKESKK